ncbi:MAG: hypothetical protein WD749_11665 [Phycisphaerales bacterium]
MRNSGRTGGACGRAGFLMAAAGWALAAGSASGQATQRAAFVGNNGNIEGSITSYTFTPGGAPVFVARHITGAGSSNPGNNVYGITLTPSGEFLATTHATALTTERITILRVNPDATLAEVGVWTTPDSPLGAAWVSDTLLAVTKTSSSGTNLVIVYRFDPAGPSLVKASELPTTGFTSSVSVAPAGPYVYAPSGGLSGPTEIAAFHVDPAGELTPIGVIGTSPYYTLGPCLNRAGTRLYGGGGISGGGGAVMAYDINPGGSLSWHPGAPFVSPGSSPSPKQCAPASDDRFMFVAHGSSSMVRSFAMDENGFLTDTGAAYDVGIQGDLGGIAVIDNLVLATRRYSSTTYGPSGLLSFTIQPDGTFILNGPVVGSQGSQPMAIAPWSPPSACYANCDGSTAAPILNVQDFGCFLTRYAAGDPYANCDGSTAAPVLNVQDFGCFLTKYAAGCP